LNLPKRGFSHPRRSIHFRHLATDQPAVLLVPRKHMRGQQLVELREPCRDGARTLPVKTLEGIGGGHGWQSIWPELDVVEISVTWLTS
jgi:hypothetical protein